MASVSLSHGRNMRRRTIRAGQVGGWLLNIVLVLLALLMFVPFYWVLVTSVLPSDVAYALPPKWLPTSISFSNYVQVFALIPFGTLILNSIKIAGIIVVGSLIVSVLAAYAFARLRFPGKEILFVILLAALMVPQQVTVIPVFIMVRSLGLMNTQAAVFLPAIINVLSIFLLRQAFAKIPQELADAARIDGAGHLRILFQVFVPLSWPTISALAIVIFQASWNDFFWPNLFLSTPDQMTLPVGLVALQGMHGSGSPAVIFAAISIILVPVLILFIFTQRALTESLATTGLKG